MQLKFIFTIAALFLTAASHSQCTDCIFATDCTSDDGFPTICPESLPPATTGEFYEETITFFMPADVVDPGSGLTATLSSVTVTSITGVPLGLNVVLDESDAVYEPSNGQTSGCANVCGEPVLAGVFDMVISISAVASAFGIEQVVNESFAYVLIVEEGAGGTGTFSYAPTNGCDSLLANFSASLVGNSAQITSYSWDFGTGVIAENQNVDGVLFNETGTYNVILQTVISDQVLTQITLNSTGSGGWDDGWSPDPDPYFVLSDANGSNVYTSSVAQESYSTTWGGLSIVLTNPPYSIAFFDEDFLIGDDELGSTSFTPNGAGTIDINANPSYAVATIGLQEAVNVTDTANVAINPSPVVGLYWMSNDTLSCSNPSLSQYNWMLGDSLWVSGAAFEFSPEENGFYSVVGTSAQGCSAQSDSLLYCSSSASLNLELTTSNTGDPELLVTNAGFDEYVWDENGIASDTLEDAEGHLWFPANSGWYDVTAWDSLGCTWNADSLLVCWPLEPPLMEEFEYGILSTVNDYALYQWFLNGEVLPGATDSIFNLEGPGLYSLSVTDFESCAGVLSNDWVVVGVAENTDEPGFEWKLYPNPSQGILNVLLPDTSPFNPSGWIIEVWDATGKQVHSLATSSIQVSLDVSFLSAGAYTVHLKSTQTKGLGASPAPKRLIKR
tara:strand:- start:1925 stop:3934 length:2010 start_codon:yes stop_codon:yes gene_type:complete